MARRVIPAELLNKETEMQFSVYVRQILLKNQTKKISSSYTKNPPPPHKTTVHHKDNKLRRQHCDMVAVCARQTISGLPDTPEFMRKLSLSSPPNKIKRKR